MNKRNFQIISYWYEVHTTNIVFLALFNSQDKIKLPENLKENSLSKFFNKLNFYNVRAMACHTQEANRANL